MTELWSGTGYCKTCQQVVDVYSEDNKKFTCGHCGREIHQKSLSGNPPTLVAAQKIVGDLLETNDIVAFAQACSGRGSHFGRCNPWSRKKFEQHLSDTLGLVEVFVANCTVCAIQNRVSELEENQLQEISDLCLSELDRREEIRRLSPEMREVTG